MCFTEFWLWYFCSFPCELYPMALGTSLYVIRGFLPVQYWSSNTEMLMLSSDGSFLLNFFSMLSLLAVCSFVIQGAEVCKFPVLLQRLYLLKEAIRTSAREERHAVPSIKAILLHYCSIQWRISCLDMVSACSRGKEINLNFCSACIHKGDQEYLSISFCGLDCHHLYIAFICWGLFLFFPPVFEQRFLSGCLS